MSKTRLAAIIGSLALSIAVLVMLLVLLSSVAMASKPARPLAAAPGDVVVNEFAAKGTEWVELYNTTANTVVLDGWYVIDADCDASGATTLTVDLGPGDYFVIDADDPGDNFGLSNSGDVIVLCDDSDVEIDRVAYGDEGGVPIGPSASGGSQYSSARVVDGQDSGGDAQDWNMDPTPTKGISNTVPGINLGSSVLINEVDLFPTAGNDKVELYNPTAQPITATGWYISDGDDVAMLTGTLVVSAGGFLILEETIDWISEGSTGVDFTSSDVAYLFDDSRVRVEQLGFNGHFWNDTAQRIPDGAGPNDGYDWTSSGGPCTLQDRPSTLGYTNDIAADLRVSKVGPATAGRGVSVDYTITYWNEGGDAATQVVVADGLPNNVSYMADSSDLSCPACTLGATGALTWSAGTLNMCGEYSFTLTAWVADGVTVGSSFTNTVDIATADSEITTTNNTDQWVTTVISVPKLAIAKTVVPTTNVPPLGGVVLYTVVLENNGDADATGVVMTDTLPPQVDFGGWIVNEGTATLPDPPGDTIVWGPWDVGTGDSYTLSFTATLKTGSAFYGTVVRNTVEFDSDDAGTGSAYAVFTADYHYTYLPLVMRQHG